MRDNCSRRAAENVAVEILKTFPSIVALNRKTKKLLLHKYVRVAEGAVTSEPVSADESLLSGKNTGKSVEYQ